MSDDRCDLTELLKRECDHCRSRPERKPGKYVTRVDRSAMQPIVASYAGRCGSCGMAFEDGETIAPLYEGTERVGWLATCCQELWA